MDLKETIYRQHARSTKWTSRLSFYADEISIIAHKLEELSKENDHYEFHEGADHFCEQVEIQTAYLEEIRSEIRNNEQALVADILRNPTAISVRKQEYQQREQKSLLLFEIGFNALREDFQWFYTNWA